MVDVQIGSVCKAKDFKRVAKVETQEEQIKASIAYEGASSKLLGGLHPSLSSSSKKALFWSYMQIEYIGG